MDLALFVAFGDGDDEDDEHHAAVAELLPNPWTDFRVV